MGLTKTDFMRGMQCEKMLWLDRHKPALRIITPETQARLDAGNDFGDRAMAMFGPYVDMTVYRPDTRIPDKHRMAEKTRHHLLMGTEVICEAAFSYYNHYCAVDILRKTETGYDFYEVKKAPELREQFVRDAAFQYYIMHRSKVPIGKIYIVLQGPDDENPFLPVEITGEAKDLSPWVNDHIWDLNRKWKEKTEPDIIPGKQCDCPYECWYKAYCNGERKENPQMKMDIG